ncbi:prenyltransferase/squalene oxidase repeat-containing protein [Crateriforma conspicua]|uniref:prenyltransferase/squalene oxidase repeat-containing protein n=1 Tax=Crateriforma conspicua TaxID=2527996 RepID=UPI001189B862|nr:prenyltransferase/squalene oxidase repeat-containing protein [Crateriforma conspicua]QDV61829.1 Prenyltransferase and squalene oxidase repeat protein [Crateriforma conspicua]
MSSPTSTYLHELTLRLALGAANLDASLRNRHADWLVRQQQSDGGFGGREGESDPYYTAFAVRSLWILGRLDEAIGSRCGEFLRGRLAGREGIVDLISLIFAAAVLELASGVVVIDDDDDTWRNNVDQLLCQLRTSDGGFAKSPEGRAGSTYQTFLSVLCYQLLQRPVPESDRVIDFIHSQHHPDGGFLEIRAAKRAGVNPTAAAIGTLKALDSLEVADHGDTFEFLAQQQSDEGGLAANTRIPFADLLSTCTGLITLIDLGLDPARHRNLISLSRINAYALSMQAEGGFHGFALDQTADVEYTFYGLATLSLVAMTGLDSQSAEDRNVQ